jgi:hypothetical protein
MKKTKVPIRAESREQKQKKKMKLSGRSVFAIKKIIEKSAKKKITH